MKKFKTDKNIRKYVEAATNRSTGDVELWYRDEKGRKFKERIEGYCYTDWYFYITKDDYDKLEKEKGLIKSLENNEIDKLKLTSAPFFEIEDNGKWVKVFISNGNINEKYSKGKDDRLRFKKFLENRGIRIYEGDLQPHKRYCIDNDIRVSNNFKVLFFDIETDDRGHGILVGRDTILSIAGYDQDGKSYFWYKKHSQSDDEDFLIKFMEDIRFKFDVLVGWNSDVFDKPYIIKRFQEHEINIWGFKKNIAHIDLMQIFIKRFSNNPELTSWKLDFIAYYFLGEKKIEVEKGNGKIYELYLKDFEKFKKYNLRDSWLLYELDNKLGVIQQILLECQITGCFPSKFSVSELLDTYILRSIRDKDLHFPSIEYGDLSARCSQCNHSHIFEGDELPFEYFCKFCNTKFNPENKHDDIAGAYVIEPATGRYDNVFVFDFKCWLKGTNIYTSKGYQKIEDLIIGNSVQLLNGDWNKIIQLNKKKHVGKIIKLRLNTGDILKTTLNHRYPIQTQNGIVDKFAKDFNCGDFLIFPDYHRKIQGGNSKKFEMLGIFDCDGLYKKTPVRNTHQIRVHFSVRNHEKEFFQWGKKLIDCFFPIEFEEISKSLKKGLQPSLIYKPIINYGNQYKKGNQEIAFDYICKEMKKLSNENLSIYKNALGYLRGCFNSDMSVNVHRKSCVINGADKERLNRIHLAGKIMGLHGRLHTVKLIKKDWSGIEFRIEYRGEKTLSIIKNIIGLIEVKKFVKLQNILNSMSSVDSLGRPKNRKFGIKVISKEIENFDGNVYSLAVKNQKNPYYLVEGIMSHNSLYPTIIDTWNIGPDSFIEKEDYIELENEDIIDNECMKSANDQFYWKNKPSIFKIAIKELLSLRRKFKNKMLIYKPGTREYEILNAKQRATKLLSNSMYGILAYPRGRFYRKEIAESITLGGQWLIKTTKKWFEEKGYRVLYGDTDSIFTKIPLEDKEKISKLLKELKSFYNESLKKNFNIDKHTIDLEYEKHFRRFILVQKKRYSGHIIEQDGVTIDKILIKGLEYVKRDTIPLGRKWQKELLDSLINEDYNKVYYIKWVEDKMKFFFEGDYDISDIIITKKLSKNPKSYKVRAIHVEIAEELKRREFEYYIGMRVPYIVTSDKPLEASHPSWYEKGTASVKYYWDKQIFAICQRILEAVFKEYDWSQYSSKIKNKRQKKIEQYKRWLKDPKKMKTFKSKEKTIVKIKECKVISDEQREELLKPFKLKKFQMIESGELSKKPKIKILKLKIKNK